MQAWETLQSAEGIKQAGVGKVFDVTLNEKEKENAWFDKTQLWQYNLMQSCPMEPW